MDQAELSRKDTYLDERVFSKLWQDRRYYPGKLRRKRIKMVQTRRIEKNESPLTAVIPIKPAKLSVWTILVFK